MISWSVLVSVVSLLSTLLFSGQAHADITIDVARGDAEIITVNCNPYALEENPESCIAKGITRENFEITVRHRDFLGSATKSNSVFRVGTSWKSQAQGNFTFRILMEPSGDKVCFKVSRFGIKSNIRFDDNFKDRGDNRYQTLQKENALHLIIQEGMRTKRTRNCILTPRPAKKVTNTELTNSFIPAVCRYGCDEDPNTGAPACHAADAWSNPQDAVFHKPALSIIVQCVSEFADNLIYGAPSSSGGRSVAEKILILMRPFALALLTLFFVLEGYKYSSGIGHSMQSKIKPKEFNNILIKAVIIAAYFGATDLSILLYNSATTIQRNLPILATGSSDGDISFSKFDALSNYEYAASVYDKSVGGQAAATIQDFSYRHCKFDNAKINYTPDKEYLRIWDILDCKLAQYLGYAYQRFTLSKLVNDSGVKPVIEEMETRKVGGGVYVAVINGFTMMWQSALIITFLAFAYCTLVFLIFVKYLTIYMSATIQIVLTFLIMPIILPTLLFSFSKDTFYETIKIILKSMIFPAVFIVFFMFVITFMDKFFYEGNNVFNNGSLSPCLDQQAIVGGVPISNPNQIALDADCKCLDQNSLACLLTAHFNPGEEKVDIIIMQVKYMYNNFRDGIDQADFIIQYGKLMLIYIVLFVVLTFCNDVSGTLTSNQFVKTFSESLFSSRDVIDNPFIKGSVRVATTTAGKATGFASGVVAGSVKRGVPYLKDKLISSKKSERE